MTLEILTLGFQDLGQVVGFECFNDHQDILAVPCC